MARVQDIARKNFANSMTAAGGARTLTADDAGKTIQLDTLTGSTVILPAATGSGAEFAFTVTVLPTSNSHIIKVANATDVMRGILQSVDTDSSDAVASWAAATASDTITFNRSTTGGVSIGETVWVKDIKAGFWMVDGWFGATGTPATPFSATVS